MNKVHNEQETQNLMKMSTVTNKLKLTYERFKKANKLKEIRKIYLIRSKVISYAVFVLLLIGFLASILYYEVNFFKDSKYYDLNTTEIIDYLIYSMQLSTVICILLIPPRRYFLFKYKQCLKTEGNYFIASYQLKIMIVEILTVAITPMKIFDCYNWQNLNYEENISTFYNMNDIIVLIMLSRLFIMIDIFLKNITFSSIKMDQILQNCNLEENYLFVIKCLLKKKPYQFFVCSLITSILVFAFGIRICELPLAIKLDGESFQSITTTVWMVMITMTTVGYGDYNPKTIPGRTMGFVLCIWGVFLMSMIVIILFQSLELTYEEKQALLIFNKLEAKKPLTQSAATLIKELWKLKKSKVKDTKKIYKIKNDFNQLQKELKKIDSLQYDYFFEKLNIYFENMSNNILKLSKIQFSLLKFKEEFEQVDSKTSKQNFSSSNFNEKDKQEKNEQKLIQKKYLKNEKQKIDEEVDEILDQDSVISKSDSDIQINHNN